VIKEKLQVSNHKPINLIKSVYNKHGLYGFYRGFMLTMAVYVPFSTTYFVCYEKLKSLSDKNSFSSNLGYAFISASLAAIVSNPMDVIHTRVQIRTVVSARDIVKEIIRDDGWKGFGRGMGSRVLWAAPSMAISIAIWETLKREYLSSTLI
jgi:Mitochondrial carrier protein